MNILQFITELVDFYNRYGYIVFMKTNNTTSLFVHIAENGDREEKERICKLASVSETTLNKILRGHMPRPCVRYRIYKVTGIKLNEEDNFPEVKAQSAS